MSDTSRVQHESPREHAAEPEQASPSRGPRADSTRRETGSTAGGRRPAASADDSSADGDRIGSSVVPIASFAAPDERTVISSTPPVPAPSHRPDSSPSELGRLLEGETLDHFELGEFIGGGGMGAVFRAVDTLLGRTVAVKVLSHHNGGDEETARRFKNEAQSAARLDHENIARVYYVGQDRGWHYIVFEFIEGENLRDIVAQGGPLSVSDVVYYLIQIAEALAHAASRDVVHRDIKPSNVLITRGHRAKLVDMGLARLHQVETSQADITASGVTLGTFDYISPEQARDPRVADIRSDIYSLGCTAYYMLCGRPPFPEGTVLQKLLQHQGDEPPDPRECRRDLPPALCEVLRKMLVKNPADRYQTADKLLDELVAIAEQLGLAGLQRQTMRVESPRKTSQGMRSYLPWAIPVALLIAIVAVVEIAGNSSDAPEPPAPQPLLASTDDPAALLGGADAISAEPPRRDAQAEQNGSSDTEPAAEVETPTDDEPSPDPEQDETPPDADEEESANQRPPASEPSPSTPQDSAGETTEGSSTPAPTPEPPAKIRLNPGGPESRGFDTIANALQESTTGDVIELRFDGIQLERPWRIEKKKISIRAAEGFRPIIKFVPSGTDPALQPRNMITLSGGELMLINLQLQMDLPRQLQADRWSLFHLVLADRLRLDRTSITLRNAAADGTAYHQEVAFFKVDAPLGTGMMIHEARSPSERTTIELRNCILRGEADVLGGDLLATTTFNWENGLLSTSERLISLAGDDFQQQQLGELRVNLKHLTADLRRGLARIHAPSETPNLFPLRMEVAESILLVDRSPLFDFSGGGNIKDFRDKLTWKGDRNFYEGVGLFWRIDDAAADDFAEMTFTDWQSVWGPGNEASVRAAAVEFAALPDRSKPRWQRTVMDYTLDLEDHTNPAIGASTDGTTNAGMQPELLPTTAPLDAAADRASSAAWRAPNAADDVTIPLRRTPPTAGSIVPATFDEPAAAGNSTDQDDSSLYLPIEGE
ncbi:MAG: protein kinase [Pirellulales bacterium]